MDPAAYRSWNSVWSKQVPPEIPIPEVAPEGPADENMAESAQKPPSATDWTVYSETVFRGNFNKESDSDPRMQAGWHSPGKEKTRPYMSTTEQQPFMWNGGYVEKDDEA
jgi:hypothetical protein